MQFMKLGKINFQFKNIFKYSRIQTCYKVRQLLNFFFIDQQASVGWSQGILFCF